MWREPPSRQRRVALAGIHVRVSINVLAISVNHCFSLEVFSSFKRLIGTKSIRIDDERLLLVDHEEESHSQFISGFCRDDVSLIAPTINEREDWRFVLGVRSSSTLRETTRTR